MYNSNPLQGYTLIEDSNLVKQTGVEIVKRTLRERFLSWPWKPWQVIREQPIFEPSTEFVVTEDTITGHPDVIKLLRQTQ